MLDTGVMQAVLQKRGRPSGAEFESLIVAELYKQARSIPLDARFHYLRTLDGREVDCLVEFPEGYFAFELKMAEHVSESDARHLKGFDSFLDKPLLQAFILSCDVETKVFSPTIIAVHAAFFFGIAGFGTDNSGIVRLVLHAIAQTEPIPDSVSFYRFF
jgi:predicted AAA+ superfamily ATPase